MRQCNDCKTYKKADNCIKCVENVKAALNRNEFILNRIESVFHKGKNDSGKIILIQEILKDYNKNK